MVETLEVYPVPPKDFCRKLYRIDPNLHLNFDTVQKVWHIWCKDPYNGTMDHVMAVVEPDGSYRPLDNRAIDQLIRNRYYQQNPDLLIKLLLDDPEFDDQKRLSSAHDNVRHLSKDSALRRRFESFQEQARLTPISNFMKPKIIHGPDGKPVTYVDPKTGIEKPVWYKPHSSFFRR